MARVVLERLWKHYEGPRKQKVSAVRGVSLEIRDGEFMVFVGPSGCGKTTVLRLIAGLEDIDEGRIFIDERDVSRVEPKDRDLAMVFQNYALYPHMTVYENMAFGLELRKMPKGEIQKRVNEAAATLGLAECLDRLPKALSGGQRQRVAVGRAIVRNPKVFLFDEPLSNLDAQMRVQTRMEILRLHRQLKATMIYVTHDQVEAMTMGTRIAVMKDGEVQQIADPAGLYARPANMFVARFIGSPPMNLIHGSLGGSGPTSTFVEAAQSQSGFKLTGFASGIPALQGPVVLGIRPEDVAVTLDGTGLEAVAELVEPTGAETFIHWRTTGHGVVSRVMGVPAFQPGARARLNFNMSKLSWFDAASGCALSTNTNEKPSG